MTKAWKNEWQNSTPWQFPQSLYLFYASKVQTFKPEIVCQVQIYLRDCSWLYFGVWLNLVVTTRKTYWNISSFNIFGCISYVLKGTDYMPQILIFYSFIPIFMNSLRSNRKSMKYKKLTPSGYTITTTVI